MRIGINALFLVPADVGGTEIYFRENLTRMVEYAAEDTFVLFTSRDNDEVLRQILKGKSNVEFVGLPFRAAIRPLRIVMEQTLLPFLVWIKKIDSLWSPGYTAPLICSCLSTVTIHDLQYKSHPDDLTWFERVTLDFLVKNSCRTCDYIIAVSEFSKTEILRFGFAEAEKVFAIPEGVDPAFGETVSIDISAITGVPLGLPFILCVAHTYPHKRVHLLVEAFEKIYREIPHHLVLVGKPRRGEKKVRDSISHLPDNSRLHRLQNLEYRDLIGLYQNCDVFVLPSEYEGFGLPVLEAMLSGVPVVASTNASIPEVGGGHVDYVTESNAKCFADSILDVLKKTQEDKELKREKGQEWAKTFSWERSCAQTLNILKTYEK